MREKLRQENVFLRRRRQRREKLFLQAGEGGFARQIPRGLLNFYKGTVSITSAVVSITSSATLPATGTTDITAPPTRIGTVTIFVKTHPLKSPARIITIVDCMTRFKQVISVS
jgi:hypothetical protein